MAGKSPNIRCIYTVLANPTHLQKKNNGNPTHLKRRLTPTLHIFKRRPTPTLRIFKRRPTETTKRLIASTKALPPLYKTIHTISCTHMNAHTHAHTHAQHTTHAPAEVCSAVMEGGIQRCPPSTITKGSMRHVRSVSPSHREYRRHLCVCVRVCVCVYVCVFVCV